MATKTAKKPTSMVKWDEKFAAMAKKEKEQTATITSGGSSIKFGRGWIEVNGQRLKENSLECVIVGHCGLNAWYEGEYDPNEKAPPDCYALGDSWNAPDMKPYPSAANKQSEDCASCDWNKIGTARVGKGKACANRVRIGALLAADMESISTAEMAGGSISPTNVYKNFKPYLDYVNDELNRPLWSVVTEIKSFDDPKTQIRLEFKVADKIEDGDVLEALEKRNDKIQSVLQQPYTQIEKAAPTKPTAGKSGKFAGKANGRGK